MGCLICGSEEYPHSHDLGTILNGRYYCPDGERHELITKRRLIRKWQWCTRCGRWQR